MSSISTCWLASATAVLIGALPMLASAQSTWELFNGSYTDVISGNVSGCTQNSSNSGNYGNSWNCTNTKGNAGTSLTASAYSNKNATVGATDYQSTTPNTGSGLYYANAYMSAQGNSGFGAANRSEGTGAVSPNHAFDNIPTGQWDGALLNFGATPYVLSSIGVGWTYNSSADITVLEWTGSGSPLNATKASTQTSPATLNGGNSLLAQSGWTLVGSYQGLTADGSQPFGGNSRATGATVASSYWLITAFNSALNGGTSCKSAAGTTVTCDEGNDAFKLNYITTAVASSGPSVPEPTSLALVAVALLGVKVARRRVA